MIKKDIGISLGSDNTYIYFQKENRIIKFKTVVSIDTSISEIVEIGEKAILMSEKCPSNIIIKRPIKKGKVEDIELTQELLRKVLKEERIKSNITNPNVLLSIDNNLNEVEKRAIIETINELRFKNLYTMDSLKLIALGIGMDISKPEANMIIDIGYETTKIGVLSMNNIINYKCIYIGSNNFDHDIINYLRKKYKLLISNKQAEEIKENENNENNVIKGKNIITGKPKSITITREDILISIDKTINNIIEELKLMIENLSADVFNDISKKGIVITGGGSLLIGLREKLEEELGICILETLTPEENIINGIKYVLDNNISLANKI